MTERKPQKIMESRGPGIEGAYAFAGAPHLAFSRAA